MNTFEIKFTPLGPIKNKDEALELIREYLGCLYKNGQSLESYELIKNEDCYIAILTLPEDDALDDKYNNAYVTEYLTKVKALFEISTELIGKNLNTCRSCACQEKPSWYMLYLDFLDEEGPVLCGTCGKPVPLYKLPHVFNEQEHYTVLSWVRNYWDIYRLFMRCLADRFTYRQMSDIKSQLTKDGRDICKAFEEATGIPFYYFVFYYSYYYNKNPKKIPATCPGCGGEWKLTDDNPLIDYKCEKCRLVADDV